MADAGPIRRLVHWILPNRFWTWASSHCLGWRAVSSVSTEVVPSLRRRWTDSTCWHQVRYWFYSIWIILRTYEKLLPWFDRPTAAYFVINSPRETHRYWLGFSKLWWTHILSTLMKRGEQNSSGLHLNKTKHPFKVVTR